jgi:iduronate 2-sulfatase
MNYLKPNLYKNCLALICLTALTLATFSISVTAQKISKSNKPIKYNVLFISSDDLRPDLSSYGNLIIKTPNVDRIAKSGMQFNKAYAQYPLCNPSRSSLLTGRYPTQTQIMDNNTYFRIKHPDYITLPQYFKNNGYVTLRSGKTFHGGIDDQISWTEGGEPTDPAITERGKTTAQPKQNSEEADETPTNQAQANSKASNSDRIIILDGDGSSHGDYKTATRAINYLETYKDTPFFLSVGFVKPHSPPTAPKKFFDLYDVNKMPLPVDFTANPSAPGGFPEISVPKRNTDLFIGRDASPEQAREMIRAYYASTSFMDEQVGRVLDALERLGLREKTIIVFWGDHGYHLGEKGKWSKAYSLYEIGLRVPLIISVPNGKGQQSDQIVQLLDMYPTLAELCGLSRPENIEGHTLVPLFKKPNANWDHPSYSVTQYQGKIGKSVRTKRWHYAAWEDGKLGAMLFDQTTDPHELKNLADDAKYAKTVLEMKDLLKLMPQ